MKLYSLPRVFLAALGCSIGASALADDAPSIHFNVVGGGSHNYTFRAVERPFWNETLPANSGGKVTARLMGLSESGLKGPEMVRVLRAGAVEIGMGCLLYTSDAADE